MWTREVSSSELFAADRWTASFFATSPAAARQAAFSMQTIGSVVVEGRNTADPKAWGSEMVQYLGLENVRPLTGELVHFKEKPATAIKSRSKVFGEGDVLFGRLRPELNKVYLAEGDVVQGLCSGEFIVLEAQPTKVLPRYLRHILASSYVTRFVQKLRRGASLPRLATQDLLDIQIPVPPLAWQQSMVEVLKDTDERIVRLRRELEALPQCQANALLTALEDKNVGNVLVCD